MSEVIEKVIELKTFMMKHVVDYPATYHAVDVVSRIVGWEEAAKLGDGIDLPNTVRQIYKEALNPPEAKRKG